MERRPPPPGRSPGGVLDYTRAHAPVVPRDPSNAVTATSEPTIAPYGGNDTDRDGTRERGQVYASVTGEGAREDVAASTPFTKTEEARYEAGPMLGHGGMGEVILHKDLRIGRHVARKALLRHMSGVRGVSRFVREARVQGQLEHPSVVPVYDFGADPDGAPFFTMKRVRGETLALVLDRLARKDPDYTARFSGHKLLAALRQVCLAIEYAHLRGVVHRDLKPGNIMLGDFGEVYVLDWGVAKLRSDELGMKPDGSAFDDSSDVEGDGEKTGAHDMIGTPAYMAPEQLGHGRNRFDIRQDVFALGAILFEILTLTRYRPGASFSTLLRHLVVEADRGAPPRPSETVPGVPPELDDACVRALAPEPDERLGSAGALAEILERYLEGDRDLGMRRAMATKLLESARSRIAVTDADPEVRVQAMRDAIKALALSPDDVEAQRLLLSLVVDGSGKLPPEAERDFEVNDFQVDAHLLRLSIAGLAAGFIALPLAIWVGVRSWTVVALVSLLNLASIGYIALLLRWQSRATRHVLFLSTLLAATLALCSGWLGPFVLVPVAAATLALMLATRSNPHERIWLLFIWSLALVVPLGLELLHVFPPAYSFEGGDLILHARALSLPEGPTLVALGYTSLAYLVLPMIVVGRLRDTQRGGDRKLFVQAWYLKKLFPAASATKIP